MTKEMQKFVDKFDPSKSKTLKSGIEIRGIVDVEKALARARGIITSCKLNLHVVDTAEMAAYGAFEVREGIAS